jgi:hypothetical protein
MGKYLKLGADPSTQNWTLPDHTDLEKLKTEIAEGMEEENAIRVAVVVGKNQTTELVVNAGELSAALVWEDVPAGGGMTIID